VEFAFVFAGKGKIKMLNVGDRIQVDKAFGLKIVARILEIQYRNGACIAKVFREDYRKEDVFVWNICQVGISVRKI
jgi:hypothetical protein